MAKFEKTVRDFVTCKEGKAVLAVLFDISKFPRPKINEPVAFSEGVNPNIVGRAFEDVLRLLLYRKNPRFISVDSLRSFRTMEKEIGGYVKSGSLSDGILNQMLKTAIELQAGFVPFGAPIRLRPNKSMRQALRFLHDRANTLSWQVRERFFTGAIAGVVLDLLIDDTAIEVKTVKDLNHHSEHVAQLLAYSLMASLPVNRLQNVFIETIAIYYSRHGHLALQNISEMRRFAKKDLQPVAQMFFEEFVRWRVDRDYIGFSKRRKDAFLKKEFRRVRGIFTQWKNGDDSAKIPDLFPLGLPTNIGLFYR